MGISVKEFKDQMDDLGYFIFPEFVDLHLLERLRNDLYKAREICSVVQNKNKIDNCRNTVHHVLGMGDSFMAYLLLFEDLSEYVSAYFGGKFILNTFGGNILEWDSSHANEVHRDIRFFSEDIPIMLNTIVMLDDFTAGNGATWLMKGGHKVRDKPDLKYFSDNSICSIAPAGSVLMFNSNMWHCAGVNKTDKSRRLISPVFSRPFIKPQYDYPRALGYDSGKFYSSWMRQILGYESRIPSTMDEFYQPPETRFYKQDQI